MNTVSGLLDAAEAAGAAEAAASARAPGGAAGPLRFIGGRPTRAGQCLQRQHLAEVDEAG